MKGRKFSFFQIHFLAYIRDEIYNWDL